LKRASNLERLAGFAESDGKLLETTKDGDHRKAAA
jgi:hypothetical protein